MRISITLNKREMILLKQLVKYGIYGRTLSEVCRRFIDEKLLEELIRKAQ